MDYIIIGTFSGFLFSQIFYYANYFVENSKYVSLSIEKKLKEIENINNNKLLEVDQKIDSINNLVKCVFNKNYKSAIGNNGGIYRSSFAWDEKASSFLQEQIIDLNSKNRSNFKELIDKLSSRED